MFAAYHEPSTSECCLLLLLLLLLLWCRGDFHFPVVGRETLVSI